MLVNSNRFAGERGERGREGQLCVPSAIREEQVEERTCVRLLLDNIVLRIIFIIGRN